MLGRCHKQKMYIEEEADIPNKWQKGSSATPVPTTSPKNALMCMYRTTEAAKMKMCFES